MEDLSDCKVVTGDDKAQDMLFKLIVIGEPSVGKSCVLIRAVKNEFKGEYEVTIGAEFNSLYFQIKSKKVQLQVWDTAGMEKFRSIIKVFFNGSQAAFIVYDITRKETFEKVDSWLNMLQETASPNVKVILVGNKKDCEGTRQVPYEMGKAYADKHGFVYFIETSAKTGEGIMEAFQKMAKELFTEHEAELAAEGTNSTNASTPGGSTKQLKSGSKKQGKGCC